ncbi:MAG: aldehyde dehydrogenase [bacterium]
MEFDTYADIQLKQKAFFATQKTKSITFRKEALLNLKKALAQNENAIYEALESDFKKSKFEAFLSEIGIVELELDLALKNLKSWTKPKRVFPSLLNIPSSDYLIKEPYGQVLLISPWNYPFQLAIVPLISAIAAGNTCVLKPSELTPKTSALLKKLLHSIYDEEFVAVIEGGIPEATALLNMRWDYIYFTGSVPVGKIIAKAAAVHMTPVTLELGGKSPCIIDDSVNVKLVARRIVWAKLLNAGQTCVAPDYLLVHPKIKALLVAALKAEIIKRYGANVQESPDYPRIINTKNHQRLLNLLNDTSILFGGDHDANDCYLSPTLIDEPSLDHPIMQEEIFGPLLPILTYTDEKHIESIILSFEKPLSFYVFSTRLKWANSLMKKYSFGGGVINDAVIHYGNSRLPFGGVGHSGIGNNHGKYGFDTFSHEKPVVKKANWLDLPFRYAPYSGKLNFIKAMFRWLG